MSPSGTVPASCLLCGSLECSLLLALALTSPCVPGSDWLDSSDHMAGVKSPSF
jgi:hypothetical protein